VPTQAGGTGTFCQRLVGELRAAARAELAAAAFIRVQSRHATNALEEIGVFCRQTDSVRLLPDKLQWLEANLRAGVETAHTHICG
jgi:hypothetical protein